MISEKDAERIAASVLGRQPDDDGRPWKLTQFDHGWLVLDVLPPSEPSRGGTTRVIERETGRMLRFPSSISRADIMGEYLEVRSWGHEVPQDA
jgi:hypothetical protein